MAGTFPYKGRYVVSTTTPMGTYYGYTASQKESDRIAAKYGQQYVVPDPISGKNVVLLGVYNNGDYAPRGFPPAEDKDRLNGFSNQEVYIATYQDPNFKQLATGNASPNTAPNPGPGTSTPAPAPSPDGGVSDLTLKYPINMNPSQDKITFTVVELSKPTFSPGQKELKLQSKGFSKGLQPVAGEPVVCLPIQPSISDSNSVEWGSGTINEIERQMVNTSLNVMDKGAAGVQEALTHFTNNLYLANGLSVLKGLGQIYLAEQAVGVQNLLSRATGQVLNPNLELLFNGPALRSFNFTFKLSPRSGTEADEVKKIINFFKKNMAVRVVEGNIFLKSPYVFQIKYWKGTSEHQSINLIKTCALQSCSVDYTPLGSYMTYEDEAATMVSYNISLQFQEIEPVYSDDYDTHPIGY
jgi:hypothetical protein